MRIKLEIYNEFNWISLNGKEYLGMINFLIELGKYIRFVNENIFFEDYLKGVVLNEMFVSWFFEVFKV